MSCHRNRIGPQFLSFRAEADEECERLAKAILVAGLGGCTLDRLSFSFLRDSRRGVYQHRDRGFCGIWGDRLDFIFPSLRINRACDDVRVGI